MGIKIDFTKNEAALALTTLVAWSNGVIKDSQYDTRVQMILEDGISQTEVDEFKEKYDKLPDNISVYDSAVDSLMREDEPTRARVCAWMWQVANVSTSKNYKTINLDHLEVVTEWQNRLNYVDVEELNIINKTRKDLKVSLNAFKESFQHLPTAKRI